MNDHKAKYDMRVEATKKYGSLRWQDGKCICTYCDRDNDRLHPSEDELLSNGGDMYNCLHCHVWTAGQSGYCIHCDVDGYNQGETLVDGPSEMPSLNWFEPGTSLHAKVLLAKEAQRVPGILFGPGEIYSNYMFRHRDGRWYPLGTDPVLAYRTMKVLADYLDDLKKQGVKWSPWPTNIDKFWDEELARKNDY